MLFASCKESAGSPREIPFEYRDQLIWVKVSVPGRTEPLNFLLDSGAAVSVLDTETARRLGLRLGKKVLVKGVHTELTGYWPQPLNASLSGIQLPRTYLAVSLKDLSDSCRCPVDGLIGADFFKKQKVQIDYSRQVIRFPHKSFIPAGSQCFPLKVGPQAIGVRLSVNGHSPAWFRLDTGCSSALEWVSPGSISPRMKQNVSVGLAPISSVNTLVTVQWGSFNLTGVPTGLHEELIFPHEAGLVGNDLLSRFIVTVDAKKKRLFLQSSP